MFVLFICGTRGDNNRDARYDVTPGIFLLPFQAYFVGFIVCEPIKNIARAMEKVLSTHTAEHKLTYEIVCCIASRIA